MEFRTSLLYKLTVYFHATGHSTMVKVGANVLLFSTCSVCWQCSKPIFGFVLSVFQKASEGRRQGFSIPKSIIPGRDPWKLGTEIGRAKDWTQHVMLERRPLHIAVLYCAEVCGQRRKVGVRDMFLKWLSLCMYRFRKTSLSLLFTLKSMVSFGGNRGRYFLLQPNIP